MTTITIQVPDGNSCKGCDFKRYMTEQLGYNQWNEWYQCDIFKCRIDYNTKCFACRALMKTEPGRVDDADSDEKD